LLPHDASELERLATQLRVNPIVAQLLLNRRIADPGEARRFLEAPLNGLHSPELLPGISQAAELLLDAVRRGDRICVYGDYDADGITGTAILLEGLRLLGGATTDFYVPNRLEEGYGLNADALRQIREAGASVVVTVDCGITSLAEAEEARRLGLQLLITDHHEPKDRLPDAALVHPRLPGHEYPFSGLSGSGVAFKLAWALTVRACGSEKVTPAFREYLLNSTMLAALGTVADVVPLHDENRILVRHGLARLKQAPTPGIKALLEAAGLADKAELRASDIGFRLGPRINAVGRLGCARMVVDLLTTTSMPHAVDLARYLEKQNQDRQTLERQMLRQARELVEQGGLDGKPAFVLTHPDWHAGVIGIVAGRLTELYGRPTLLVALRPDGSEEDAVRIGQGSGRSIPGFPLHEALQACDECLISHGGHKAAAGFKIRPEHLDTFRARFCDYAAQRFPNGPPPPRLVLDAEVPLSALTFGLLNEIDRLEPYGSENAKPVFLAGGLEIVGEPRRMGGGERHVQFRVRQGGTTIRAVAFGMADRLEELMCDGGRCCLAFTPVINEWQGYRNVEIHVTDWQPGPTARLV
jgi:single-stranded-DNA-specific exonuclease